MDISTPFDLAILARSDCIVHPHKTKLLCQCHCSENNSDQKSKNSTHSRSKKCKSRSRSPEVFAIVTSSNLMSSSSSNNEGIVIEFFEFMSDCLSVGKFSCYSDFTWNQFWLISVGQFCRSYNFGGFEFWFLEKFHTWNCQKRKKPLKSELLKWSKWQFLWLQSDQNWIHVKTEWQKILRFPHCVSIPNQAT